MEEGGRRGAEGWEEEGRRRRDEGGRKRDEERGRMREEGIGGREMDEWKKLVRKSLEEAEITESVILMILRRVEEEEVGIVHGEKQYKLK